MNRYLVIESRKEITSNETMLVSLFSNFLRLTNKISEANAIYLFFDHDTEISFNDIILNITSDTLSDFRIFVSHQFKNKKEMMENLYFVKTKLMAIPFFKYVYLDNKIILQESLEKIDEMLKKQMFLKHAKNEIILKSVKTFLESNQNTSRAAKELFVHRNTLIQRLDKFHYATGFDVKVFKDAFLIYHLLK